MSTTGWLPKVVFFNGPPHCGKDTAVRFLLNKYAEGPPYHARRLSFASPLKLAVHALFAIDNPPGWYEKNDPDYKSNPTHPDFYDQNPRQAYIDMSEKYAKVLYGDDFFGQIALKRMQKQPHVKLWLISDSGFQSEALPVVHRYGKRNVLIVRMTRQGCSFEGDSRSYWDLEDVQFLDLHNRFENDFEMFEAQVVFNIDKWLAKG